MNCHDVIIVGGGPCGLSAAIELQQIGLDVVVIEKGTIVNSIYNYPTHQTFFSSSIKLSIGDIPFITAKEKPKRNDALVYYREVATLKNIQINSYEQVEQVEKIDDGFTVTTSKEAYRATFVVIATGYYDHPNHLEAEGANLPKVHHYFKEAHPYYQKKVLVIGGKNSAVDAALELHRAGAEVTVAYRGEAYSPSVKPWILPGFDSLVRNGDVAMHFNSVVRKITPTSVEIDEQGNCFTIENDEVFAMIGYHPNHQFLREMGVEIDGETGRPTYDEQTMESNVDGLFIAGVIAAGNNANEIFIENGRFHGEQIAEEISKRIQGL